MTQLGSGFQIPGRVERNDLIVRGELIDEVRSQLDPEIRRLETLLRNLIPKMPDIKIPPTQVSVAAPTVNVSVPEPPEQDAPFVSVNLDVLAGDIRGLRGDVAQLVAVLKQPVTRTVIRDRDGFITGVTETRA
jgi:hypothetical protein